FISIYIDFFFSSRRRHKKFSRDWSSDVCSYDLEKYVNIGKDFSYEYDRETLIPRIYSDRPEHVRYYRNWLNLGENEDPVFSDNLKFLFSYQLGHMYARYFMWNFAGRQNNEQGFGNFTDGNWISGIQPIDQMRLGGQQALPESATDDPSRNTFYFL